MEAENRRNSLRFGRLHNRGAVQYTIHYLCNVNDTSSSGSRCCFSRVHCLRILRTVKVFALEDKVV